MKKNNRTIVTTVLVAVLLVALTVVLTTTCRKKTVATGNPPAEEYVLPLIETTDIHGHIVDAESPVIHYRLAYIADKVKDIRGHDGRYDKRRLLLLDGGDIYQGTTVSNLQKGEPLYVSMDLMDYDAVAVGNHEFDWGLEAMVDTDATLPAYTFRERSCSNEVPVVCANLYRDGSRTSCTRDYVIVEKTAVGAHGTVPVKIAVIGFAEDYASSVLSTQFSGKGYSIREDYAIANGIATELESSGQCDATVLLTHGEAARAAGLLGRESAIDLVLGGHTHIPATGTTDWGLVYAQAGRKAENYTYAELRFRVDDSGRVSFSRVDNPQTLYVDTARDKHTFAGQNANDLDEPVLAVSGAAVDAVSDLLNDVIGHITVNASKYTIDGSGERATVMGNWMCDIIRRIAGADVAFVNKGSVRTYFSLNGHPRRDITVSNVYDIFPFGNSIYVYQLTYAELLRIFEYAMTSRGQSIFSCMTGLDCHFSQSEEKLNASGKPYRKYAVLSLVKDGVTIYRDGRWTGNWASRTLTLAVSDYIATTQREDTYNHLVNPLPEWNDTPRLKSNNLVDNESAIKVLRAEAAGAGGHLTLDTVPHFIVHDK